MDHAAPSAALRNSLPLPLLSAIAALPPLAVDMYLPAMPQIANNLAVALNTVQNSLSIFLLGFGAGMLLYGPLADRHGRRPLALLGLLGFCLTSLLLVWSPNATLFLLFRLMQGLLGSAAAVTIPAMIRDCYGKDTAKGMSTVMMIMLVAPLVAPLFGSWILAIAPWQGLFVFQAIYAVVLLFITWRLLPETKPSELIATAQSPSSNTVLPNSPLRNSPLKNYQIIFSNRHIYVDLLTYVMLALAFFVYLTSVSFIYITWFKVSETMFGYLFACSAGALILANFTNRQLVSRIGPRRMLAHALSLGVGFALLLVAMTFFGAGLIAIVAGFFCLVACLGVAWVNADALVIMDFPHQASSASAVIGTLRFGFGALAGPLLALTYTGTPLPVMLLIFGLLLAATILQFIRRRRG
jgi:MFS transporter, DHA1 family, multidrug resistance protein